MFARFDEIPSMTLRYTGNCLYKKHSELRRETNPIVLAPSSKVFIISICLEDRYVFARFDEIPSITLKILRKLYIQKPLRITKGNYSNSISP